MLLAFALSALLVLGFGGAWITLGAPANWPANVSRVLKERSGEQIYSANCLSCHLGPSGGGIDDIPPRHNAVGHTWHHPDCALIATTREGSDAIFERVSPPGTQIMPAFKERLSAEQIEAVLVYIRTMWTPEQRKAQASFTREMCFS